MKKRGDGENQREGAPNSSELAKKFVQVVL